MDDKTKIFVSGAQKMLKKALKDGTADKQWLNYLKAWSQRKCFCGIPLEVVSFTRTGSGATWAFKCGHQSTIISLEETISTKEGYSASRLGFVKKGFQNIVSRIGGISLSKEDEEISVVKTLCHFYKPHLKTFRNDKQDSPIDVIAKTQLGEEEFFQVTKLQDKYFWKEINTRKSVDIALSNITSLVEKAIKRKSELFEKNSKKNIVLVINAWPGVMEEITSNFFGLNLFNSSGFKEIWLSGPTKELTYKLYP